MGYGGFIHITNNTSDVMLIKKVSEHCMDSQGNWGDPVLPGQEYSSQYIEACASGSCINQSSTLKLEFSIVTGSSIVSAGALELKEDRNKWSVGNCTPNIQLTQDEHKEQEHMWFNVNIPT